MNKWLPVLTVFLVALVVPASDTGRSLQALSPVHGTPGTRESVTCNIAPIGRTELEDIIRPERQRLPTATQEILDMFQEASEHVAEETVSSIEVSLEQLVVCSAPGNEMSYLNLYTEEYLSRHPEAVCTRLQALAGTAGPPQSATPETVLQEIDLIIAEVRQLRDGRIAALIAVREGDTVQPPDIILVFVQIDASWLIDEALEGIDQRGDAGSSTPTVPYSCPGIAATPGT